MKKTEKTKWSVKLILQNAKKQNKQKKTGWGRDYQQGRDKSLDKNLWKETIPGQLLLGYKTAFAFSKDGMTHSSS